MCTCFPVPVCSVFWCKFAFWWKNSGVVSSKSMGHDDGDDDVAGPKKNSGDKL